MTLLTWLLVWKAVESLAILYLLWRKQDKPIDMGTVTPHQRYWTDRDH